MALFEIKDLTYFYPQDNEPALHNINLSIHEGEFILVLGESGSGKSTLGRTFNRIVPEFYGGKLYGTVNGMDEIGMVFQDPEKQLVMNNVERELAFGLENLGIPYSVMKRSIMETLSFLGLTGIKNKNTYELSGGEKQKVAIGTALAINKKFLVLDEPTSQLDPTTSDEILYVIERLNRELGYTIVMIEQRVDRCFHLADRILFMKSGELVFDGCPQEYLLWANNNEKDFLPLISRYFASKKYSNIPITVKKGRDMLREMNVLFKENKKRTFGSKKSQVIKAENVTYKYSDGTQALNNLFLEINSGDIVGIMGQNGSGKSTLLKAICRLIEPKKGSITTLGEVGYLSQNPNDYLFSDSVYDELKFSLSLRKRENYSKIEEVLRDLNIQHLKTHNPRDLSGGERQRVALASVMVTGPDILLLDEPTRGLDGHLRAALGEMILDYQNQGKTVIVVTHDVEFVAKFCTKVCLMFQGEMIEAGNPYDVFSTGMYYTTQMNKLFKGFADGILTLQDALTLTEFGGREKVV